MPYVKAFDGLVAAHIGIWLFLRCAATRARAQKFFSPSSLETADRFINSLEGLRARAAKFDYWDGQNRRYQFYVSPVSNGMNTIEAT